MTSGYYSLIQFCPDRFKAEAVNIGLVFICAHRNIVLIRTIKELSHLIRIFKLDDSDLISLPITIQNFVDRIKSLDADQLTIDGFTTFAQSRANDIRLTNPRLTVFHDVDLEFDNLFNRLITTNPDRIVRIC